MSDEICVEMDRASVSDSGDEEVQIGEDRGMGKPLHLLLGSHESRKNGEGCSTDIDMENKQMKRGRQVDKEEIWTTVSRKGKRFAQVSETDDRTIVPVEYVGVYLTRGEKLPKQFMLAKRLKGAGIQNVVQIKFINAFKVYILFNDAESADILLNTVEFNTDGFKCQKSLDSNQSYGIIRSIDLGLSDEVIAESLGSEIQILEVKRLKRKNSSDGRWEQSESVRVCFKGKQVPTYIYIFDVKIRVYPYVHPVTQCSRCWRFGHTIRLCSSNKTVCPKCGGNHANCETTQFKCNNCGGCHMALAKVCPKFKREKQLREIMCEYNCSYKQALTFFVPTVPAKSPTPSEVSESQCEYPFLWSLNTDKPEEPPKVTQTENSQTYAKIVDRKKVTFSGREKKVRKKSQRVYKENVTKQTRSSETDAHITEENKDRTQEERKDEENPWWKVLLVQLKEKILERDVSWEEKIKSCVSMVIKKAISYAMQYVSELTGFNFLSNYG